MGKVANTIFEQLGGKKFVAMTGAKRIVAVEDGIQMRLAKNASKANHLEITLNALDLYDMKFTRFTDSRLDKKTCEWVPAKNEEIAVYGDLYFDQLQTIFTAVTGMRTRL